MPKILEYRKTYRSYAKVSFPSISLTISLRIKEVNVRRVYSRARSRFMLYVRAKADDGEYFPWRAHSLFDRSMPGN